jgi:tRNA1(Val) A37 N6-methylase TrmN6
MEEYHALSLINAKRNKINANLILGNFFTYENLKKKIFDQIFFNPPYYPVNNYKISDNKLLDIANIEYPGILKKMLNFSLKRCKPYGYITLIHRPARLPEILSILTNGSGDIKIQPIVSSHSQISSRVIIRARKSAKGETKLFNPISLYKNSDKSGLKKQYTSKIQEILKNGNALNF